MNQGLTLVELAQQIDNLEKKKNDVIAPASMITAVPIEKCVQLQIGESLHTVGQLAHEQLSDMLKIPRDYYRRMKESQPALLASNINTWLREKANEKRLIRSYDRHVRAILSDRYKPQENHTLAYEVFPYIMSRQGQIDVLSAQLTEKKLYLKLIDKKLESEFMVTRAGARVGEVVRGGICISNSEVGAGAAVINSFVYILSCTNGMMREHSLRSIHVGKKLDSLEDDITFYSQDTMQAIQEAFRLKLRDSLGFAFDEKKFLEDVRKFQQAADNPLEPAKVPQAIENVTAKLGLAKAEGESILDRMYKAADFSQWGLSQAVTNLANDVTDYDRIVELETIGGKIIDMTPSEWSTITR